MMRMKEGSYRPLKDQHNKHKRWYKHTIQYCYMYMLYRYVYMGVMIVLEGIELVGLQWRYGSECPICFFCDNFILRPKNILQIRNTLSVSCHDFTQGVESIGGTIELHQSSMSTTQFCKALYALGSNISLYSSANSFKYSSLAFL